MPLARQYAMFPAPTITHTRLEERLSRSRELDGSLCVMLEAQAQVAYTAAQTFYNLLGDIGQMPRYLQTLEQIGFNAEDLRQNVALVVNAQAGISIDREDVSGLTTQLADITDTIEAAAFQVGECRLQRSRPHLDTLVGLLVAVTQETKAMVRMLRYGLCWERLASFIAGIHALKTRGDKLFRQAVCGLSEDETLSESLLYQWKEVYGRIEQAIKECARVGEIVRTLTIKYPGNLEESKA